jgi:hypothetical protein
MSAAAPRGDPARTSARIRIDASERPLRGKANDTATQKGKPMSTLQYQEVTLADFEAQAAMMTPFTLSFEELEEEIDRLECSGKVAEAVRQEFENLTAKLNGLILRKVKLQKWIRALDNDSK